MAGGVVGPAAFTGAWLFAATRQTGYSAAVEHVSGLAAADATAPQVMAGGFLCLGCSLWPFASAVREALGGPGRAGWTPGLVRLAAVGVTAAGVCRRDRMLLWPPDDSGVRSWHNHAHDAASAVAYSAAVAAPATLAARVRHEPEWAHLRRSARAVSAATGALLALFAAEAVECNGYVQRAAVTLPAAATAALAVGLWRRVPPEVVCRPRDDDRDRVVLAACALPWSRKTG